MILVGVFLLTCGKAVYGILGLEGTPIVHLSTLQVLGVSMFGILYTHCKFTRKNLTVSGVLILGYIACLSFDLPYETYIYNGLRAVMVILAVWGLVRSILDDGQKKKISPKRIKWSLWL